jgi:peptidoglycan/xylan/chitin deacetylase (PgdA/CDA1 family)
MDALAGVLEPIGRRGSRDVAVLTYHRVDDAAARPHLHPGLISATPAVFERQLDVVATRTNPVTMDAMVAAVLGKGQLPDRPLLVTVDDGYEDFAEHIWPRLRRRGVPVTLFVPTGYPGDRRKRFWWDRLSHALRTTDRRSLTVDGLTVDLHDATARDGAFRRLRTLVKATPHEPAMAMVDAWCATLEVPDAPSSVLDWDALRALAAEGVTLAPHTRTHALLTQVDDGRLAAEVEESRIDLAREIGTVASVFAYPSGAHDDRVVAAVRRSGFDLAFTTDRGRVDLQRPQDPHRLRRINIGGATSSGALRLQLIRGVRAPQGRYPRS